MRWRIEGCIVRPGIEAGGTHTTTLDLYGHVYPGEMDRYADRLNEAAGMTDAAKMRPDDIYEEIGPEDSMR